MFISNIELRLVIYKEIKNCLKTENRHIWGVKYLMFIHHRRWFVPLSVRLEPWVSKYSTTGEWVFKSLGRYYNAELVIKMVIF